MGRDGDARRIRATPFPARVLLAFADDSVRRGDYDPAVWAYERLRAEAGGPAVPGLVLGLARAYFASRRPEDARALLRETSAPREVVAEASCYRGDLLLERQDHAGALAEFEEVRREMGPPVPAPLAFRLGKAYFAVGRGEDARAMLETVASPPNLAGEAALYLGQIAKKRGDGARAREWFEKSRALDPEFWERNRAMLRQQGITD
ncbi:MAG: tetratricopeptide repeat protein [Planctomycetales bacterium]|nr:tetratricopeptide repeat protein [Planctomycetales bacterium]